MSKAIVQEVAVNAGDASLPGLFAVPARHKGAVVFAHGSGSSRNSPRNRYVADILNTAGFATLLFDLLTGEEEAVDARTRAYRFDIDLLARRLVGAVDWLGVGGAVGAPEVLGLFGASTGAAAAIIAAAERPERVWAVVSRGGRPDMAGAALPRLRAPALLLVGALDEAVVPLNESAAARMQAEHAVRIVPGASHLFEEPGALETVAEEAKQWFARHLI